MEAIQNKLQLTNRILTPQKTERGSEWKQIVGTVKSDLDTRKVVQKKIPNLAEICAKIHTGESIGGKGVLLMGTPGTGKTFLLRSVSEMFGIPFVTALDLERCVSDEDLFRETLRLNRPRWSEIPKHWNDLIIDDIGTEESVIKDYGRNYKPVEEAIERRYNSFIQGFRTHFTTNLTEEQIQERYGKRCWSRLNEMCTIITIVGIDRRTLNEF